MSNKPIKTFKKGFVNVAIFERVDNFGNTQYSIAPQNGYFDKKTNKIVYNHFYDDKAVLVLGKLIDMAWKFIYQEHAKIAQVKAQNQPVQQNNQPNANYLPPQQKQPENSPYQPNMNFSPEGI
jgi:hypothetical protein